MPKFINDGEFQLPPEEVAKPAPEFRTAEEVAAPPQEVQTTSEFHKTGEIAAETPGKGPSSTVAMLKKMLLYPVAATIAAVTVVYAAFGQDVLVHLGADDTPKSYILTEYFDAAEGEDVSALIYAEDGTELKDKSGNKVEVRTVSGVSYDIDSNTLTLDNYSGKRLFISKMGGDFTLKLKGASKLDHIVSDGYGDDCSVSIVTGNDDGTYASLLLSPTTSATPGITLNADGSASKLTIGEYVSIGIIAFDPVAVYGTTLDNAIDPDGKLSISNGKIVSYDGQTDGQYHVIVENTAMDPTAIVSLYISSGGGSGSKYGTVTWNNDDGSLLMLESVDYGLIPTYKGPAPTKASDAQYDYMFTGWTPALAPVSGDVTYTAVYTATARSYTVTWRNDDGTVLETDMGVLYGVVPTYDGETPVKIAKGTTYTFKGWSPDVSAVTGDVIYTALFTSSDNTYTVLWQNDDGSLLETDNGVKYGETPVYDGSTPEKADDAQYTYKFAGWSPEVSAVTGDVTYVAVFTSAVRTYTVSWENDDGSLIAEEIYDYGDTPSYTGSAPTKAETAQYRYTFSGWSPEITSVAGDVTYTATYTESLKYYTITFMDYDNTLLWSGSFGYGTVPTYGGTTPTREPESETVTYVFSGWNPSLTSVTGAKTYTATYDRVYSFPTLTDLGPSPKEDYRVSFDFWTDDGNYNTVYAAAGRNAEATHVVEPNLDQFSQYSSKMSYDPSTNTLTLNGVNDPDLSLQAVNMGNGFTINVIGTNRIRDIYVVGEGYSASLTVTGTGTLQLGDEENCNELTLYVSGDEGTMSRLMIDSGVTLDIYSCWRAFAINNHASGTYIYYDDTALDYIGNEITYVQFEGSDGMTECGPVYEFEEGVDFTTDEEYEALMQGAMHVVFRPKT